MASPVIPLTRRDHVRSLPRRVELKYIVLVFGMVFIGLYWMTEILAQDIRSRDAETMFYPSNRVQPGGIPAYVPHIINKPSDQMSLEHNMLGSDLLDGNKRTGLFDGIRTYYINLDGSVDRSRGMSGILGESAVRVRAVNGTDVDDLLDHFQPSDLQAFIEQPREFLFTKHRCVTGQLGNYLSHLNAISRALSDGAQYVVIVEDDLSDTYRQLWPAKLTTIVQQANKLYPKWYAIRLQWHDYEPKVQQEWKHWVSHAQDVRDHILQYSGQSKLDQLDQTWGNWPDDIIDFVRPYKEGWGNVATLWNRQGLQHFVDKYRSPTHPNKWQCLPDRPCSADLSFWVEDNVLITIPPLIGVKFTGISTSEIRNGVVNGDHALGHRRSALTQLAWLMETREIFKVDANIGQVPILPPAKHP
ncbi:putative transmembrane protein [Gregarina niphandrodes]|uniref:Transmembrane protein n=1 Tax=Gregarina niphandrodes TaxID=110365 RepID=A0A023BCJ3_GRENI|nr:putative transmembrane protein [Gregarina niphandrodes]EZG82439.1 putative transmembrane protein [Gregarina niphandrodes]|eukprot:XP_011129008.1 putative transmembrane protein [Gregarina niphandrodes]